MKRSIQTPDGTLKLNKPSFQGDNVDRRSDAERPAGLTFCNGFFDLFMSRLPGVVSIVDSEGRVVYVNRYYEEISGRKIGTCLGRHCSEVFDKDTEVELEKDEQEMLKNENLGEEIEEFRIGHRTVTFLTHTFPIVKKNLPLLKGRISVDITKRKQMYTELKDREDQVRDLSNKIFDAHEEERKRIGMELHDTVASSLSAIKLSLERNLNNNEKTTEYPAPSLEEIITMVKRTSNEVRKIMGELRPSLLDDLGIIPSISAYCREFQTIHPCFTVEKQIRVEEQEIPERLKIVIFRILQEALTNAGKYSNGSAVSVSLEKSGGSLVLTIGDNGRGFSSMRNTRSKTTEGLGISSMDERAALSGGSFFIDSAEGKGTAVRVVWALDEVKSP